MGLRVSKLLNASLAVFVTIIGVGCSKAETHYPYGGGEGTSSSGGTIGQNLPDGGANADATTPGTPGITVLAAALNQPAWLSTDGSSLYFTVNETNTAAVSRVSMSGGAVARIDAVKKPRGFAFTGGSLYLAAADTLAPASAAIYKVGASALTSVVSSEVDVVSLRGDAGDLFWLSGDGGTSSIATLRVYRGGTAQSLGSATGASLANTSLAIFADTIYFSVGLVGSGSGGYRVPRAGASGAEPAGQYADTVTQAVPLATDVFGASSIRIFRQPLASLGESSFVDAANAPVGLQVSANRIYWAEAVGGRILSKALSDTDASVHVTGLGSISGLVVTPGAFYVMSGTSILRIVR